MSTFLAPFTRRSTYSGLLFLALGIPLGTAWFVLLLTLWVGSVSVAFTAFLALPLLVALGASSRWAASRERGIANSLLGARVVAPGRRPLRGGLWQRAKVVLRDGPGWREQAYLFLRFPVGLTMGVIALSLPWQAVLLLTAPLWYWLPGDLFLDFGFMDVDTIGEALLCVPVGAVALVLGAWVVVGFSAAWRGMARGLLGGDPTPPREPVTPAQPPAPAPAWSTGMAPVSGADRPGDPRRRRVALMVHAAASALVFLLLSVIWLATTPGDLFWPVWVLMPLAAAVGVHGIVWWVRDNVATHKGVAIHAGVSIVLSLWMIAIWMLTMWGEYFWPVWVIVGLAAALGVHVMAAFIGRGERIEELTTSRAGAVDLQTAELRRIERDLHDGAQARLVALAMDLGMAEEKLGSDPDRARELVGEARAEARKALVELRDLARGIHPPVLTDRGLAAAVAALADRSPVPVTIEADVDERPAAPVESAAYFTVAEALTNAAKHSGASRIDVRLARRGNRLSVEVEDDGAGGADPDGGGLTGLRRRVEALDGRLEVDSPAGGGTRLRAELPCGS